MRNAEDCVPYLTKTQVLYLIAHKNASFVSFALRLLTGMTVSFIMASSVPLKDKIFFVFTRKL